jgi:hypothetical protein
MKSTWLLLVLLAAGLPAVATEMYSWTDANGVRHFSDSPPPANVAKAQKIKVTGGVTSSAPAEDVQKKEEAAKSAGPALAAAAGYSADDIKRNCDVAKKNLGQLQAQKLPVDAEGYPVDLDAAKNQQAQIDKTGQQIKLFCGAQ